VIFSRYAFKVKENEIHNQQTRISDSIINQFDLLLKIPGRINNINHSFLSIEGMDQGSLNKLQKFFVHELNNNPTLEIIALGLENGNYIEAQHLNDGSIRIGERTEENGGALDQWEVDKTYGKTRLVKHIEKYDHRRRPWYLRGEGWSAIYFYSSNHHPAISHNRIITDKEGNVNGVLTASISLNNISTFLHGISKSPNSKIIVLDPEGYLIGTSFAHPLLDSKGNRIQGTATSLPSVNRMVRMYRSNPKESFTFPDKGSVTVVRSVPLSYSSEIMWHILIMTPQKDFTVEADRLTRRNILFLTVIFLIIVIIVLLTSRTITKPVKFLAGYISQISYDKQLENIPVIPGSIKNSSTEIKILTANLEVMLSKMKAAFFSMEESRREYREFVENINTIVMRIAPDGTIRYCNPYGLSFYGYTEEELVGKPVQETVLRGTDERPLDVLKSIFAQDEKYWNGENQNLTRDGKTVWILWANRLVRNTDGEVVELLSTGQDITERKESQGKLQMYLKRNSVLLSEIHHRVKNNLQIIISLINLQLDKSENPATRAALQGIKTRIQSMALVHEMLYSASSFSNIDLNLYIQSLSNDILQTFRNDDKIVTITVSPNHVFIELEKAITVGLILSELISNSVKYAFEGRKAGKIDIGISEPEEGKIEIMVEDNGTGIAAGQKGTGGLGTILIEALTQQLDAEIDTKTSDGFSFRFTFKTQGRHTPET